MINRIFFHRIIVVALSSLCIYAQECSEEFTFYNELPETAIIICPGGCSESGDSCLSNIDLGVLDDIIFQNSLNYPDPINVGNQQWKYGRLIGLVASYNPNGSNGVNEQLTILPESIGNLSELKSIDLKLNSLNNLPNSFSQLINLTSLTLNNNWLSSLPEDIGNINQLFLLDLGYNQLASIPPSICEIIFDNTAYVFIFNNNLSSLPDCMCNLDIDWNGFDGGNFPYFGSGANLLCDSELIPDCIENSINFELSLDQFYYSTHIDAPQECDEECFIGDLNGDNVLNVLDVVSLANCVLAGNCSELQYGCAGDINVDGEFNVLDIVTLANCVLSGNNCSN